MSDLVAHSQVLVLGSGIAGLSTALKLAGEGLTVTVVAKQDRAEGATRYAQGGIASVWSTQDTFDEHKADTLRAGAGLCRDQIVDLCVREGPARVRELIGLGVEFTRSTAPGPDQDGGGTFDLHREGGHGRHRILHAADLTGWAIERALLGHIEQAPSACILEHHIAVDLITEGALAGRRGEPGRVLGAYVLDAPSGRVITLTADVTVLATGGAGKVYLYTSNPDVATGDGIAMAYRAGARVANLEFMQFHPTCLFHPEARTFLISEAVRGEGAVLRTLAGEDFMPRYHPMGSLAPRDIVARAVDMEMKRSGDRHVLLDCSGIPAETLVRRFPNIHATCLRFGLDITRAPIPVVPAAHYMCGGVLVDENGQSDIPGLYAVGEVACTGLHGANRLASNSLLEAVVFGRRVAAHATSRMRERPPPRVAPPPWDVGRAVPVEEQVDIAATWLEIRQLMWHYVGIVRSTRRLERARRRLELLKAEIHASWWGYLLTRDLIELRNLLTVAELIVQCAAARRESRGLHYTLDYPATDEIHFRHDTVISRRSA